MSTDVRLNEVVRAALENRCSLASTRQADLARLQRCLSSLDAFPLPLTSVKQCKLLRGFNQTVLSLLEQDLSQTPAQPAAVAPASPPSPTATSSSSSSSHPLLDLSLSPISNGIHAAHSAPQTSARVASKGPSSSAAAPSPAQLLETARGSGPKKDAHLASEAPARTKSVAACPLVADAVIELSSDDDGEEDSPRVLSPSPVPTTTNGKRNDDLAANEDVDEKSDGDDDDAYDGKEQFHPSPSTSKHDSAADFASTSANGDDDDEHHSLSDDYALALRLSQELNGDEANSPDRAKEQEDKDYKLALELNRENYAVANDLSQGQQSRFGQRAKPISHAFRLPGEEKEEENAEREEFATADFLAAAALVEMSSIQMAPTQMSPESSLPSPPKVASKAKRKSGEKKDLGKKKSPLDMLFGKDPVYNRLNSEDEKECESSPKAKRKKRPSLEDKVPPVANNVHDLSLSSSEEEQEPIPSTSAGRGQKRAVVVGTKKTEKAHKAVVRKPASPVRSSVHALSDSDEDQTPEIAAAPKTKRGKKKTTPKKKTTAVRKARKEKAEPQKFVIDESELPDWFLNDEANVGSSRNGRDEATTSSRPRPSGGGGGGDFCFEPGQFEVLLLVDNQEVNTGSTGGRKTKRAITTTELKANGVPFETRRLTVGDFLWIAREKSANSSSSSSSQLQLSQLRQAPSRELVLPHVVERKRMDDLKQSIVDGRYREQKQRLFDCGLKHKWYLVEGYDKKMKCWAKEDSGFSLKALDQAVASTSAVPGFNVKLTASQTDSMTFLTMFTRSLRDHYHDRRLFSCSRDHHDHVGYDDQDTRLLTFKEFNEGSKKTKTLSTREYFCHMLCQLSGLTMAMAKAITERYRTMGDLMEAYQRCDSAEDRENLLVGIPCTGTTRKKINKQISQVLAWLYNDDELL